MISIYLHEGIIDTFRAFGEPKSKMVEALSLMADGVIDIPIGGDTIELEKLPRDGAKRIELDVPDDIINNLPKYKIRQLLYWFVDNEMYDELGWKVQEHPRRYCISRINKAIKALELVIKSVDYDDKEVVQGIITTLRMVGSKYGKDKPYILSSPDTDRVSGEDFTRDTLST